MGEFPLVILVYAAAALGILALLRWRFPRWGFVRTSLLAALPLPALTIALCIWVYIDAVTASRADCGVDACGMAIVAAIMVSLFALAGFAISWAIGAAALYMFDRRGRRDAE